MKENKLRFDTDYVEIKFILNTSLGLSSRQTGQGNTAPCRLEKSLQLLLLKVLQDQPEVLLLLQFSQLSNKRPLTFSYNNHKIKQLNIESTCIFWLF